MPPVQITIVNRLPEMRRVADMVDEFCALHALPRRLVHETQVVLDEVLSNVIHYAYADAAEHEIRVALELSGGELLASIEDDGMPFDPTQAVLAKPAAERVRTGGGGIGLAFMRALSDRISYRREAGRNRLKVAKRIQGDGPAAKPNPSLGMSEARHEEASVLGVEGRLDTPNAQTLKERLEVLIVGGRRLLAVDLSRVSYISSAGFWALLFAERMTARAGGGLVLCGLSDDVARLVERGGLAQVLRITATREDALRALRGAAAKPGDAPLRPGDGAQPGRVKGE